MKILMINLPSVSKKYNKLVPILSSLNYPSFNVPLNLCYLATPLIKAGHNVKILDLNFLLLKKFGFQNHKSFVNNLEAGNAKGQRLVFLKKILKKELKNGYDLVGLNGDFINASVFILKQVKLFNPNIKCIVGGHTATRNFETFLKKGFDFVVLGDGEDPILEVVKYLEKKSSITDLYNIAFIYKNKIYYRLKKVEPTKLPPIRNLVDYKEYMNYTANSIVFSSRGCKGSCIFCSRKLIPVYSLRNIKELISEIKSIKNKYTVNYFWFYDDNINNDEIHLRRLCLTLIKNKLNIKWACYSRAENLSGETIKLMSLAGCKRISFGIESGSPKMLTIIKKNINLKKALQIIRQCKKQGILVRVSLIYDLPGETWKDILLSLKFLMQAQPHSFYFYKLQILQGSFLYDHFDTYFKEDFMICQGSKIRKRNLVSCINIFFKDVFLYPVNKFGMLLDLVFSFLKS
ncbi:MAG: radical SAM protein [Candidatus Woesearchaeota archaeon]